MIRSSGVSSRWRIVVSLALLAFFGASNVMVRAEMQASWTPNEEERTVRAKAMTNNRLSADS